MGPDGALSSDEVNFLIYRYLLEAGFTHSAFVFGCESTVNKVNVDGKDVPIGALVSFIQKGFQFMELEANLNEEGTDVYGKYTSLSARDILTKDIKELREAARELKLHDAENGRAAAGPATTAADAAGPSSASPVGQTPSEPAFHQGLFGHTAEVHSMSYSMASGLLATGAADGSARIWRLGGQGAKGSVLCASGGASDPANDMIVAVEWAPNGKLLAAATGGGGVLVWRSDGSLRHVLPSAGASALALQWSRGGSYLACGFADGSISVWDSASAAQRQRWALRSGAPVFDLHWRDDAELTVAGEDGSVVVFRMGQAEAVRTAKAHGADGMAAPFPGAMRPETVNMVRWDPSGSTLASASNDMTVGLWSADPGAVPQLLPGHKREVSWLAWSGNEAAALLASGSQDGSVRVWDCERQECSIVLDQHKGGITCVAWDPEGGSIAAGDLDGNVTVWNAASGVMTCAVPAGQQGCTGQVVDLQWVADGSAVIVAYAGSAVVYMAGVPQHQKAAGSKGKRP